MRSIFEVTKYKQCVKARLDAGERGARTKLAAHLTCQTSYLARVLNQDAHFTQEQALKTAEFLEFSPTETSYFMLLYLRDSAQSQTLKNFYEAQLQKAREDQWNISEQVGNDERVSSEGAAVYYSAWYYAAIHMAVGIAHLTTSQAIAQRLTLSEALVERVLAFLCEQGLVVRRRNKFAIGQRRIHVPRTSPFVASHHRNARLRAIEAFERDAFQDQIHYSLVMSLKTEHLLEIKKILMQAVRSTEAVLSKPGAETLAYLNLDCFEF